MSFKVFLLCSLFVSAPTYASFYVENGNVMSEVQTYTKGNKSIVLIDMIHVAPKSFFKGVNHLIRSYESSNPLILQEGVGHCAEKGDIVYLPGKNADFSLLAKLYKNRFELDNELAYQALKDAGFEGRVCTQDSTIQRPGIIDRFRSRFSLYGILAGLGFVRSQGTVKVYPNGVDLESGDIASGRFFSSSPLNALGDARMSSTRS